MISKELHLWLEQKIIAGTLAQLFEEDFGPPLHSLVIVGSKLHVLEADYMKYFVKDKNKNKFDEIAERLFSSIKSHDKTQ